MIINPYLDVTKNCEDAFLLYQRAFDGEEPFLTRYNDSPNSAYVYCSSVEQVQRAFNILAEKGEVISKLTSNPLPHDNGVIGMVKDIFGFAWVLSA